MKDDVNLYAYVSHDAINGIDPSGSDAIIHWRGPTNVSIVVPTRFSGPAKNKESIKRIQQDVRSRINGQYTRDGRTINVQMRIYDPGPGSTDGVENSAELLNGPTSHPQGVSFVRGGTKAEINMSSPGIAQGEATHEVGHLAQAKDHYEESVDEEGNRTTEPDTGWEGSLFSELPGEVDSRSINEMLDSDDNVVVCQSESDDTKCPK